LGKLKAEIEQAKQKALRKAEIEKAESRNQQIKSRK